jgi:hypothetical protein
MRKKCSDKSFRKWIKSGNYFPLHNNRSGTINRCGAYFDILHVSFRRKIEQNATIISYLTMGENHGFANYQVAEILDCHCGEAPRATFHKLTSESPKFQQIYDLIYAWPHI